MTFLEFLENPHIRNQHVAYKDYKLYVRRSIHLINREQRNTIDIGSIETLKRRQGRFELKTPASLSRTTGVLYYRLTL